MQPIEIFIAYSHQDLKYKNELKKFLRPLLNTGQAVLWDDHDIEAGQDWEAEIKKRLYGAEILLLLVSPDSLASEYFYGREVAVSLERHERGEAVVVPVILRPCPWTITPLKKIEALPDKAKPVTTWASQDEAFTDIAHSIGAMVERRQELRRRQSEFEDARRRYVAAVEAANQLFDQQRYLPAREAYASALALFRSGFLPVAADLETRMVDCKRLQHQLDAAQKAAARRVEPAPPPSVAETGSNAASNRTLWLSIAVAGALLLLLWVWRPWRSGKGGVENKHKETPAQVDTATQPAATVPSWLTFIKGGTYTMGDTYREGDSDETPHSVTVNDFYLSKYEVSFDEFDAFCAATKKEKPSDSGWGRGKRPAINVDWYDAIEYCNWRSQQEGLTPCYMVDKTTQDPNNTNTSDPKKWSVRCNWSANGYRLPTEAEWEYAAREGGKKVRFGNGREVIDPSEINFEARSNYKKPYSVIGKYREQTVPVDALSANALKLKNMSGNVLEWCWDWYGEKFYAASEGARHPKGADSGSYRVLRGGSCA